jgi:putative transposase
MPGPQPTTVELTTEERAELERLVRAHTTAQQVAVRAQIILAAAEGLSNVQIGQMVGLSREAVRLWRDRWVGWAGVPLKELSLADRLADAPRPGAPARIGAEQVCAIIALACEAPAQTGRPITQWTAREIADEVTRRGIVETISPRHAARLLKRGICSPIWSAIG